MPELPEVELARRDLMRWTGGQTIQAVSVVDPSSVRRKLSTRPDAAVTDGAERLSKAMLGAVCTEVRRHGKRIAWAFDSGLVVLVHLGMSGKWVRRSTADVPHARIRITMPDGLDVVFVDPRRFGCVVVVDQADANAMLTADLGPDALDEALAASELARACASRAAIKTVLLDQRRLAGMGNIQAGEALWRAGIAPGRPANSLRADEWSRLALAMPEQLRWTLDVEGDGEITYVSEWGSRNPFAVYGREAEPCPTCDTPIVRAVHSGRSSFWCPQCQR